MSVSLTRRGFGGAAIAAALLPRLGLAQTMEYANPELLMAAQDLVPLALPAAETSTPLYRSQGMLLLDIRSAEDYASGHIPGALHLDPNAVVAEQSPIEGALLPVPDLAEMLSLLGIDPETRVVIYDDRGGFHAARMFWLLEYLGHQSVALLNGGLSAYQAAGGRLAEQSTPHEASIFVPAPMPRRVATADYVLGHRGDAETVVIDVRPPAMYDEGHIPWAINLPWVGNLDEDGFYKPAEALTAHFAEHGVTADRNVVIHCQVGLASSHSYVALRLLGFPRVRVYHRSWAEWGVDDDLPRTTGS
ncbi:sulfurtransferase [Fontisubflavum oceani]|uniref:sulfurtransferase n=1 Tax=Fontisubflavum oceani TaxID=2978973 RepID=UPI0025B3D37C|nr:sulfurtransferase [Fontisubflavum oceani]WJY23028.1 sulfurtransferase [Fontisubflavum oceani]